MEKADRVVVVSEPMRTSLINRHASPEPGRVVMITNGFDSEDFDGVAPVELHTVWLSIVHAGSFYSSGRTPLPFLNALRSCIDKGKVPAQCVQVYLVGNNGRPAQELVAATEMQGNVVMPGYLPHRQSISYFEGVDILLLIVGAAQGREMVLIGKIFEIWQQGSQSSHSPRRVLQRDLEHKFPKVCQHFGLAFDAERLSQASQKVIKEHVRQTTEHDPQDINLTTEYKAQRSEFRMEFASRVREIILKDRTYLSEEF